MPMNHLLETKNGKTGGKKKFFNSDIPFNIVTGVILTFVAIIYILPLLYIVNASFSSAEAIFSGKMLFIPKGVNIEGYKLVFQYDSFWRSYLNTIFYCILALIIAIPFTVMAAYPLSREDFVGKKFIMIVYTITMFFSGGLVPTYLLMTSLGLYDSPFALVLPGVSVWNIIVVRQYFMTRISKELFEAASIDGCSNFRFLLHIGFPLSGPIVIVISMYTIVGQWNSYFNPMVYLSTRSKFPLQLILRELLLTSEGGSDINNWGGIASEDRITALEAMRFSTIILLAVPIIVLYAFVQKYFVKGVMVGSLKG